MALGNKRSGTGQKRRKGSTLAVACLCLGLTFWCGENSLAQIQRHPANVTTVVAPPYSVYLSDYFAPGSRNFSGNVLFNDFNETSWTFRLKLTIQSTDIRLQTRPGFVPSLPITVQPGVPYSLTGEEWEEYFDFNHLQASGRNVSTIVRSGRLPEGMYSFCLQVLDYATGDPLSAEHCQNVWIQLMDPPRMISPACNTWVDPATATIQPFTWQLFNTGSANSVLGTEFQLTMWELTQPGANPLSAVANGQALQVFQSPRLGNTTYAYGPADPMLEAGKTYIYQVQALDPGGKDKFKNNGKSEFCYFNYGWPVGGSIGLVYPAEGGGFKRRDQKYIRWTSPNNMAPTQTITYEVDIKPVNKGQVPADALRVNKQWYYRKTPPTNRLYDQTDLIPQPDIEQGYAWQVKAFTGDQEVAKSKVGVFYGPSVVERFYAADHRIEVDYLSVKDLNNLTGGGKVRLSKADVWTDITFSGLKLKAVDDYHVLEGGEITISTKPIYFALSPRYEEDGEATLEATSYKINRYGLFVQGTVTWELPFAQLPNGKKKVVSEAIASDFNDFQLSGTAPLARGNSFELLDPYGFGLDLSTDSKVHIINNVYHFEFRGTLTTPSVQTVAGTAAVWAFANTSSLKYLEVAGTAASTPLKVIEGTGLTLLPGKGIIDLDEFSSPGRLSGNPQWKGVYLEELVLRLPEAIDTKGQFRLNEPFETTLVLNNSGAGLAHITAQGLTLKHTVAFGAAGAFGTFASTFTSLTLDITNQQVGEKSRLQGTFLVPFIDTSKPLDFEAQLFNRGFRAGTIAGVDNRSFRFNPNGGELALDLRIRKGEMVDNERLQLTIDVGWPALGVKLEGVSNFNIWGDHSVGFYTPEGIVALSRQVNATFRGYPVTIDALSAGRSKNYYGIAVSGKVVMGDDVSGDNGAPAFNLYSLAPNPLLSNDYTPAGKQVAISLEKATGEQQKLEDELAALEEDLTEQLQQQTANLESTTADLIASASASLGGEEYAVEDIVMQPAAVPETDFEAIQDPKERLIALIEYVKPFLNDPSSIDSFVAELQDVNDPTEAERTASILLLTKKYAKEFAVRQVASLGDDFLQKVDKITYDVNAKITGEVNGLTGKVHEEIDQAVGNLIATISADVIASISQQAPDAGLVVEEIANSTREAIVNEVVIAINISVNQNVVFPLTTFISTNLSGRAHNLVQKTAEEVVFGLTSADGGPADIMKGVLGGFEDELAGLGGELAAQVDMDKLLSTIRSLGQDAVAKISAKRIADNIKQGALEAIAGAVASKASAAASELANNLLGDEIGIAIPLDFGAAGAKLLAGGNPKDLLFDPIPVKVRSPALDLNGIIHFTKAHPTFGDSWSGDVTAYVKVPKPFELKVAYLSGRKDGTSFWLAEVGGAVASQSGQATDMNKVGGDMDGKMQDAPSGLQLGIIEVMALRGRVYHHMQADELKPIVPNANTKYGAFLHMIMFGPNDGQRMRLEVNASMSTFASGDYTVSFDGNAQFINKTPNIYQPDPNAVILATLSLKYNSAEQHFYGFASAVVNKPGVLCAEGSLLVDVKPGAWRVALGSRDDKLRFILACAGYGPTGWLDLNQNTAQLGLGLEFLFFTTVNLDVKLARVGLVIDAGASAGILTTVQYNPDFALMEAGLWLELWAKILLSYKLGPKEGSVNLVDIYMAANATMRFHPAPTLLYGDVSGNIKVLFLNFGFNKQFTMNL